MSSASARYIEKLEARAKAALELSHADEENTFTREGARDRRACLLEILRELPDVFRDVEIEVMFGIEIAA